MSDAETPNALVELFGSGFIEASKASTSVPVYAPAKPKVVEKPPASVYTPPPQSRVEGAGTQLTLPTPVLGYTAYPAINLKIGDFVKSVLGWYGRVVGLDSEGGFTVVITKAGEGVLADLGKQCTYTAGQHTYFSKLIENRAPPPVQEGRLTYGYESAGCEPTLPQAFKSKGIYGGGKGGSWSPSKPMMSDVAQILAHYGFEGNNSDA